jgi:hypothetical protein
MNQNLAPRREQLDGISARIGLILLVSVLAVSSVTSPGCVLLAAPIVAVAAHAKHRKDSDVARQNLLKEERWNEFAAKYNVQEEVKLEDLRREPQKYSGRTIAVRTQFDRMLSSDTGSFEGLTVIGVPSDLFRSQRPVVLAAQVNGAENQVVQLTFVGAYLCDEIWCSDITPPNK